MQIIGKILGGLFGFLVGRVPGLIVGVFIGHMFDKARQGNFNHATGGFGSRARQEGQAAFFKAAFAVMGHVAKAKGRVLQQDIELATIMMDRMNLQGDQRRAAQSAFREGKSANFPLEQTLGQVRITAGRRSDLLQFFLDLQISAAFSDGHVDPSERQVLHKIANGLGFSSAQLEQRLRMQEAAFHFQRGHYGQQRAGGYQYSDGYQQQGYQQSSPAGDLAAAYKVLGVSENDDEKSVKRAYRKLMNEYHPDKLVAKGLPPEMLNVAKEKSQEIQNAYDLIKKYGLNS